MRLPDFILANVEPIVKEWESFARSIWPGPTATQLILRDHAADMLRAVAMDMKSSQTDSQQADKSMGLGEGGQSRRGKSSDRVDDASNLHARSRLSSGFELRELVAEYRALRASVIQLWLGDSPETGPHDIQDIIRFNEGIDQLLAESVACFVRTVDASRECFLGILGHDLRNPLAGATMIAHLLEESPTLDAHCLQMTATLRTSLDAMDHLIRDLLDFTGTRLGARMVVTPRLMEIQPLCREVLDEMKAVHPSRTFVFVYSGEVDLAGEWDARRLRQLISNLLGNAVQHGSAATPVTLAVTSSETGVLLEFRNSGPAIPDELLGVIFDPMRRRQTSGTIAPVGSVGLGLYIAREVAEAHGGSITVVSDKNETVFTVGLPRRSPGKKPA
jgi:signal transduction histidine kinase